MIVPLIIRTDAPREFPRENEPVTVGVPLPQGLAPSGSHYRIFLADGLERPCDTQVLDRWKDGSARWVLVDFQASLPAGAASTKVHLEIGDTRSHLIGRGIRIVRTPEVIEVDTGVTSFTLSTKASSGITSVRTGGELIAAPDDVDLRLVSDSGAHFSVAWRTLEVEWEGALRTVVVLAGNAVDSRGTSLGVQMRLEFFSASAVARIRLTVRNPAPAVHPGGIWELGDTGSVLLKECGVRLRLAKPSQPSSVTWSAEPGSVSRAAHHVRIYQESSGGDRWASANHRNRRGVVPMTHRGFRLDVDGTVTSGLRATPVVAVAQGDRQIGAAMPRFWQNFPRAVGATDDTIDLSFWPPEFPDVHELQGGEQKTHEAFLLFGPDEVGGSSLEWCLSRLVCHAEPRWYAAAAAAPYLTPAADDPNADYLALVGAAVDGGDTFEHKRERVDEYGWRHFGDIYGDHEAVSSSGPEPLVSHYNNQYDPIGGLAYQFMRTGDPRWWRQCVDLANHVIDIDIYHTDRDKAAYNQGLFWHTVHYVDAGLATHRSYPRGTVGGGPASEQNYTTGLMLHYFMTGDHAAREASMGLARFVLNIDDGSRTVFKWLSTGHTGLATASASLMYQGPGRGSGNSLNAVLDGYRLSGGRHFLDKADQIIRRCVHPAEDPQVHDLLDVERKWFYTMFLQSLGKYLDVKIDIGEFDEPYRYAQSVLLRYARWMRVNERPYLDRPELLEFPTETWPAQDMRKSEVFNFAARHARGDERDQFVERARYYFRYSTGTLMTMGTRTLARPVVLLLSFGFSRAFHDCHPEDAAPRLEDWTEPDDRARFVPQRMRAARRAKALLVLAGLVFVTGAGWTALRYFWR